MRLRRWLLTLLLAPASLGAQSGSAFALPGRTVALLIGTDSYGASAEWQRLSSPVFDATTLAQTLAKDFTFDTTVVRNATKSQFVDAIVNQGKRATGEDDWVLIFIAAHGFFDDDRSQGYLVFSDSKPRSQDVARSTYLSLTELRAMVEGFKAGHVLLVIDACYAGSIDPDIRTGTSRAARTNGRQLINSLLQRSQLRSRQYLTSGGKEYVFDGKPGDHSPFAGALLGALREASIEGRPIAFSNMVGHMVDAGVNPLPRHNYLKGHEPGAEFVLVPRSFDADAVEPVRASEADTREPVTRGASGTAARSNRGGGSSVANSSFLVKVKVAGSQRSGRGGGGGGEVDQLSELAGARIRSAFEAAGAAAVLDVDSDSEGFAVSKEPTNCTQSDGANGECIEVLATLTRTTIGNQRHYVSVVLTARSRASGRSLGSADARTNPYLTEVPIERIAERAIDSALGTFVQTVVGNLGGSQ